MAQWQLQDAKARFSELVRAARERGPQTVTVRGESAVVVLSERHTAHSYLMERLRELGVI